MDFELHHDVILSLVIGLKNVQDTSKIVTFLKSKTTDFFNSDMYNIVKNWIVMNLCIFGF